MKAAIVVAGLLLSTGAAGWCGNPGTSSVPNRTAMPERPAPTGDDNAAHFREHENDSYVQYWYEWWYATLKGGERSLLVMFFTFGDLNRPLSRLVGVFAAVLDEDECAERLHASPFFPYRPDGTRCNVTIGPHRFYEEDGTVRIVCTYDDLRIAAEMVPDGTPFTSVRTLAGWQWAGWHVAAPYGTGTATVTVGDETFAVNGAAYHDHNWGMARARDMNWDWLEVAYDGGSLIYGAAGDERLMGGLHLCTEEEYHFIADNHCVLEYEQWDIISGFAKPVRMRLSGADATVRVNVSIQAETVFILGVGPVGKPYLLGRMRGTITTPEGTRPVDGVGFYEHHGRFGLRESL
jgi:hypothetical protein